MEALSDPKAFLQAQEEKRVAQVIYCKIYNFLKNYFDELMQQNIIAAQKLRY